MKYIACIFLLFSSIFSYCQNIDTDEQAVFWDGSSVICYPPIDYEFTDKSNRGKVKKERGFLIQNHIPLTYYSTESPNIRFPKRYKGEVGIPEKNTFYYRVNFLKKRIELFNCDILIESYEILDFKNGKNKLVINCLWESGKTTIYLKGSKTPTFRQVKFDEQGELEGVWVNKEVKIFKIKEL